MSVVSIILEKQYLLAEINTARLNFWLTREILRWSWLEIVYVFLNFVLIISQNFIYVLSRRLKELFFLPSFSFIGILLGLSIVLAQNDFH